MRIGAIIACTYLLVLAGPSAAAESAALGAWPFDGSLADASGRGHDARGAGARYAPGSKGMALRLDGQRMEIPSHRDLQLAPGLTIDCRVYFDTKPAGYQVIVLKEREYQIRVDSESEGGRFRFFVYLNGWEPRVGGVVPEAGRWYHLVARWDGSEISLEVDGRKYAAPRSGTPVPTDNPVCLGGLSGRLDELSFDNPHRLRDERLGAAVKAVPDAARTRRAAFGAADGWSGWRADGGAAAMPGAEGLRCRFPDSRGVAFHPGLDLDVSRRPWVTLDLDAPTTTRAALLFATEKGHGSVTFPVWGGGRPSLVDLSDSPDWTGRLRMLGVALPDGAAGTVALRRVWVADRPEGRPFLYARSLSPGRAILRAGREEQVLATVRSLGAAARDARAALRVPVGVKLLDPPEQGIPNAGHDATRPLAWRVAADKPTVGTATLVLSAEGFGPVETPLPLRFEAPAGLPTATYVPEPVPAKSDYLALMHYCPLWKAGTHYGWERIEPWPNRRPAIGWYNEGTPEVADWHIKYALEHGIQGFIYCWYRRDFSPEIHQSLGHAVHDGLLKARYLDRFRFTIMWENGCAKGVQSRDDMMHNVLPYWIRNYFKHPSYVKIGNKPLLFVWRPERVAPELGGSEATRRVFDEMRAACRAEGFDGLLIVGCPTDADPNLLNRMRLEGWDASTAYAIAGPTDLRGRDPEGITTIPYAPWLKGTSETWAARRQIGALPDIVDVMMGWDPRPWHGERTTSYQATPSPAEFREACLRAKRLIDSTPGTGLDRRLVVFDNWNEFGEGHYLEPTSGFGFGFLDAIRDVFCPDAGPHQDVIPEDVGLKCPEDIYLRRRAILAEPAGGRRVVDNLVAAWSFEEDDDSFALDSSACKFHGVKTGLRAAEGVRGKGFLCDGGTISLGADPLFFPPNGITVEAWVKTDVPGQGDRWILSAVSAADSGYRLGLGGGKIVWQIPATAWSHALTCPEPLPLGRWVHVAATYDNETMRVYLDGEEASAMPRAGRIRPATAGPCLGSFAPGHPTAFFRGVLDEVRLYDRALSPDEVRAHSRTK